MVNKPTQGDFWQADHIHAVAEGGGQCGLSNFRTLCTACHLRETAKLLRNVLEAGHWTYTTLLIARGHGESGAAVD